MTKQYFFPHSEYWRFYLAYKEKPEPLDFNEYLRERLGRSIHYDSDGDYYVYYETDADLVDIKLRIP